MSKNALSKFFVKKAIGFAAGCEAATINNMPSRNRADAVRQATERFRNFTSNSALRDCPDSFQPLSGVFQASLITKVKGLPETEIEGLLQEAQDMVGPKR